MASSTMSRLHGPEGGLANVFVYVEKGLEGKQFETSNFGSGHDQSDRLLVRAARAGNSNRANTRGRQLRSGDPQHSPDGEGKPRMEPQPGPGRPANAAQFHEPEVMIPVKCNIHSWMHAYLGVVDNPYFAVSRHCRQLQPEQSSGGNLYSIAAWQEKLGTQQQTITIVPGAHASLRFTFK